MERLRNILVCLWKHSSPSPASRFSNLLELIRKIVCFFNRNKKRAEDFQTAENLLAVTKTPSIIMKATSVSSHLILWIPCAYYTSPVSLLLIVIHRPPHPLGNFLEELNILLSIFPTEGTPPRQAPVLSTSISSVLLFTEILHTRKNVLHPALPRYRHQCYPAWHLRSSLDVLQHHRPCLTWHQLFIPLPDLQQPPLLPP